MGLEVKIGDRIADVKLVRRNENTAVFEVVRLLSMRLI